MRPLVFRYFYSSLSARLFSTGAALVAGVVSLKLFDLYLSPAEFGIMAVALQLLMYLPLLDGGVRTAANVRLLSASSESEREALYAFCQKFYSWFGACVVVAALLVMAAYGLSPNIRRAGGTTSGFLIVLGLTMALTSVAFAQGGMLVALGRQHFGYWIQGISSLINLGVLAIGLKGGLQLWAFPLAIGAALLFSWPAFLFTIRSNVPGFRFIDFHISSEFKQELKRLGAEALHSFRTHLSIALLFSLDLVIVGMLYPPREAATYALFTRVFGILRSLIQSAGEVSWPMWAQNRESGKDWSYLLLKGNAWIYGSLAGALAFSLIPFLRWFMGPEWTGGLWLFTIMLLRFLITGLSNPAGFFLIGRGQFRALAKVIEVELVVGVMLALGLKRYGPPGVAAGFLFATMFGTCVPILFQYAALTERRRSEVLGSLWFRAVAGFAVSVLVTAMVVRMWSSQLSFIGGAVGTGTGLAIACLFAYFHWRRRGAEPGADFSLRAVMRNI